MHKYTRRGFMFSAAALGLGTLAHNPYTNETTAIHFDKTITFNTLEQLIKNKEIEYAYFKNDTKLIIRIKDDHAKRIVHMPDFFDKNALLKELIAHDIPVWTTNPDKTPPAFTRLTMDLCALGAARWAVDDFWNAIKSRKEPSVKDEYTEEYWYSTAVHEAGHAISILYKPTSNDLVHAKIYDELEEKTAGHVQYGPPAKNRKETFATLKNELIFSLAGRAAEQVILGKENIAIGAFKDLQEARETAEEMVWDYGVSENISTAICFADNEDLDETFTERCLNRIFNTKNNKILPKRQLEIIEEEVQNLLNNAMDEALALIEEHKDDVIKIAKALIKHEKLDADEIRTLIGFSETPSQPADQTPEAGP